MIRRPPRSPLFPYPTLFRSLLYQVATAGLEPEEIARPVRAILRRQSNTEFRMTEVTGLDPGEKQIDTTDGPITYDYLILAVGGQTNYFGLESVPRHAFQAEVVRLTAHGENEGVEIGRGHV